MPKFNGDWFHPRTSGKLSELATIQNLYKASRKTEYFGKSWGSDRKNPDNAWIFDFSEEGKAGNQTIQPSTMQTKIRNFMRLGFLKDNNSLPLNWTTMGSLWSNSIQEGEGEDSNLLYRMIIANAISTRSFSNFKRKFDVYPQEDSMVVKNLINYLDKNTFITTEHLQNLADGDTKRVGKNYSYWLDDLLQSGLFKYQDENKDQIMLNNEYEAIIEAIRLYKPNEKLPADTIIAYPLAIGAPFRNGLIKVFEKYGSEVLLEAVSTIKEVNVSDKLIENKTVKRALSTQTGRSGKWSVIVKNNYNYKCSVPGCDAEGSIFIEAAHIMPFSINDVYRPEHKTDPNNGVALCLSCHKMYDAGLFTFDKDGKIEISNFIFSTDAIQNVNQSNVNRIIISNNNFMEFGINNSFDDYYTNYHKEHIFLGE